MHVYGDGRCTYGVRGRPLHVIRPEHQRYYGRLVVVAQEERNVEKMLRDVAPSVTELAGDFRVSVPDFAGYS